MKSGLKFRSLTAAAALVTGVGIMAAMPASASTMTINFENGYSDNEVLNDGDALLDSAGNTTSVTIETFNSNTMSVEASGDFGSNPADTFPDGFVNDPIGANDVESFGGDGLGNFFLRNTEALNFDATVANPVFSLLFGGKGVGKVSAEIWDIDGNTSQGTEQWTVKAFDSDDNPLGTIISPTGTTTNNFSSLNGQPWAFTFSNIGAIAKVDFDFTGTKTRGIGVAFDNLTVSPVPLPAAGLLLLGSLGGLAALRRRRKAA